MKIILFTLNASYMHTSLAIRSIAVPLRKAGYQVECLEYTLKDRRSKILERLYQADADFYGFSAYLWNIEQLVSLASDLKALRPKAKIVFGGPEVGYRAQAFLQAHPWVDHIITGEGEAAFLQLVQSPKEEKILHGGVYADFCDSSVPYSKEELSSGQIFYYESARGCPYRCAYCLSSVPLPGKDPHAGARIRAKSVAKTLSDLLAFEEGENIKVIKFVDRTFNFDKTRAKAIWQALSHPPYTKRYHFEICASLLDEESFAILAAAPPHRFQLEIGVQSTHKQTLEAVCRPDDTDAILSALARLKQAGNVHVHADLIAGLPYEGFDRFGKSFDALFGKCDQLQLGFLKMLHGCTLRRDAKDYGYAFSSHPPYEVLESAWLSYPELCRLHRIADLVERFSDASAFSSVFPFLLGQFSSPFAGFCALEAALPKEVPALSQKEAYLFLFRFASEHLPKEMQKEFLHRLCFDYLRCELTPIPEAFPKEDRPVLIQDETMRKEVIARLRRQGQDLCPSAIVLAKFCFTDGIFAIDRQKHRTYSFQ